MEKKERREKKEVGKALEKYHEGNACSGQEVQPACLSTNRWPTPGKRIFLTKENKTLGK